jgi:hypothetical protein
MQRGSIVRKHGAWYLRYRMNGKESWVRLADHNDQYRTVKSVRGLAEPYLQAANYGQRTDK